MTTSVERYGTLGVWSNNKRCDGTICLQFYCLMCILCLRNDFWMCHAILGSTFRNKTTSKLRPLTTVPIKGDHICEVLLYYSMIYRLHGFKYCNSETLNRTLPLEPKKRFSLERFPDYGGLCICTEM